MSCLQSDSGSRRDGDDFAFRVGVAEELGNMLAYLGEGVAAAFPGVVKVVERVRR
jgi:hypothetical protein